MEHNRQIGSLLTSLTRYDRISWTFVISLFGFSLLRSSFIRSGITIKAFARQSNVQLQGNERSQ